MIALPEPRPVLWPLRTPDTARVDVSHSAGVTAIVIRHAPLRGVTPEMLAWWYRHVPGTMPYAGREISRYLVWHPLDHIDYSVVHPAGASTVAVGTRLHIREAFQRNPDRALDFRVTVQELLTERAVIGRTVLGSSIVRLTNEFAPTPRGADYTTTMRIGDDTPLAGILTNRIAHGRAFPERNIRPWIRHHIEEIGNLANFLPDLVRGRADQEP